MACLLTKMDSYSHIDRLPTTPLLFQKSPCENGFKMASFWLHGALEVKS
uniref:Uncharacterized protein n=1 Tax=Anguilla anguilla TaxID=7936 RepID=A0A0E9XTZ2_ANGAN